MISIAIKWEDKIINETKVVLPDVDKWAEIEDKRDQLIEFWDE